MTSAGQRYKSRGTIQYNISLGGGCTNCCENQKIYFTPIVNYTVRHTENNKIEDLAVFIGEQKKSILRKSTVLCMDCKGHIACGIIEAAIKDIVVEVEVIESGGDKISNCDNTENTNCCLKLVGITIPAK